MGFQLGKLRRPAVRKEYIPHESVKEGEGLQVELNLDLLTLELMEQLDAEIKKTISDIGEQSGETDSAEALAKFEMFHFEKMNIRFKAQMLGGKSGETDPDKRFVRSWDMVGEGDKPIPVSYEVFEAMPKPVLDKFYDWVTNEAAKVTKKNEPASSST